MIKNDPVRKQLRRVLLMFAGFILLIVALMLIEHFNARPGHSSSFLSFGNFLLFLGGAMIVIVLLFFPLLFRVWKRVDQRRELARQGDRSLLAIEQPVPNDTALQLPTTIRLRWKPRFFLSFIAITLVPFAIALAVIFFVSGRSNPVSLLIFGIVLAITLLTFIITGVIFTKRMKTVTPYQVEANENGLIVLFNGHVTIINWKEAQLFAVSGINKPRRPKLYELSNPDIVARWMWLPRKMYLFYPFEPELPYEEYDRKMQALLEFIEAKTHLPLYDLTETTTKWYL